MPRTKLGLVFAICASACVNSPERHDVRLTAIAGRLTAAGLEVTSHRSNGQVIDRAITDSYGEAVLGAEDGSYITMLFFWQPVSPDSDAPPGPETAGFAVTVPAPPTGQALTVFGPPRLNQPIAGALQISASAPIAASRFFIELGCTAVTADTLPVSVPVPVTCLGTDSNLEVVVRAIDATYQTIGYRAGQVQITPGPAKFDVSQWDTSTTPLQLMIEQVDPVVRVASRHDGLEIDDAVVRVAGGPVMPPQWSGMSIDGITVRAFNTNGSGGVSGLVVRDLPGLTSIDIAARDFSTAPPSDACVADLKEPVLSQGWRAAPLPDVDVIDCVYGVGNLAWHVVVPARADGRVVLPFPVESQPLPWAAARYFDATDVDDFATAIASGIHLEHAASTLNRVITSVSGEVRSNF